MQRYDPTAAFGTNYEVNTEEPKETNNENKQDMTMLAMKYLKNAIPQMMRAPALLHPMSLTTKWKNQPLEWWGQRGFSREQYKNPQQQE